MGVPVNDMSRLACKSGAYRGAHTSCPLPQEGYAPVRLSCAAEPACMSARQLGFPRVCLVRITDSYCTGYTVPVCLCVAKLSVSQCQCYIGTLALNGLSVEAENGSRFPPHGSSKIKLVDRFVASIFPSQDGCLSDITCLRHPPPFPR